MTVCDTTPLWRVWVDTGGTFTDCLAVDPEGGEHRAKVLSSGALRARLQDCPAPDRLRFRARWRLPEAFTAGAQLRWLERPGQGGRLLGGGESRGLLRLAAPPPEGLHRGEALEIAFGQEASVLAARLATGTGAGEPLPPLELRVATTRGTNALLERRGAPVALFVTRGFGDLLRIGDQRRPDLFALDVRRPEPLYREVVEVEERLWADGSVRVPLAMEGLEEKALELLERGIESAAVAFLNSYRNPEHEERVAAQLRRWGFAHVSSSASLAASIKILPRAETAVVDAYLGPILRAYLEAVESALPGGRLHMMTSAGGLRRAAGFQAKDSLLSGPAGGVVGAVRCGRLCGEDAIVAFDMGGTSTDVSRFAGDHQYLYEHRVGAATVAAPAIDIETVAAGGGSICGLGGWQLKVGPESAGADPGPAAYGAGGPLTLTDVNLLLGRLDPERFGIPVDPRASRRALAPLRRQLRELGAGMPDEELLAGWLRIADERMAEAVRTISVRRGYDPRDHALVAFGGAGGQHACAVAELLGIRKILAPVDAGILSALGLGAARLERFAHRQVLAELARVREELESSFAELAEEAVAAVAREGIPAASIEVRRRICFLRLEGQESCLEIELRPDGDPAAAFAEAYRDLYGYEAPERRVEVESLRVVASSREGEAEPAEETPRRPARAASRVRVHLGGGWRQVAAYSRRELDPGRVFAGPALVFEEHATHVVHEGWQGWCHGSGTLILERPSPARGSA